MKNNETFNEWFGVKNRMHSGLEDFKETPVSYCKVHRSQFVSFFGDIDDAFIRTYLPDVRYVVIRRKDVISQAVSFYLAKKSSTFTIVDANQLKLWQENPVEINDDELLSAYDEIKDCYGKWDKYICNTPHIDIDYEDLINDSRQTIEHIFNQTGIDCDDRIIKKAIQNVTVKKMCKTETEIAKRRLLELL